MKSIVLLLFALALLALPGLQTTGDACPACEARWKANLPLNQHDIWNDETLRDSVPLNCLSIEYESTLRDSIPLNCLSIESEPTLRDSIPLNRLNIESEPTLRDTVQEESPTE